MHLNNNSFNTPILLIIFNRPDITQLVFEKIREVKPPQLFIAADGPRKDNKDDKLKCEETRKLIINHIDWDCKVETLFQEDNLGCRKAVSASITWFFNHVEEGIILEDDCLADISFFFFCQELLGYYKNNDKIMLISGDNFQNGRKIGNASYYFSKYCHIWGWASWRRAWAKYDTDIKKYPHEFTENQLLSYNPIKSEYKHWKNLVKQILLNKTDTWASNWMFSVWYNNGLCILPNVNLISNIGFTRDGTHTTDSGNKLANIKRQSIHEIIHPQAIEISIEADTYTYYNVFYIKFGRRIINFISTIIPAQIKKMIR